VKPSPEHAFDTWFKILGFSGRHALNGLPDSLTSQLRDLQKMYNDAFAREKKSSIHVTTLPLYLDYLDADYENAIATNDGQHYAFVGVTLPLVFKISDVCKLLSKSDAIAKALRIRVSDEPLNEIHAVLFYSYLSFVVGHEWTHHKHGHVGQFSDRTRIYEEVLDTGLIGNVAQQVTEVVADGYSAFFVLSNLYERRENFLSFLRLDPSAPLERFDEVFLSLFVIACAGNLFMRRAADLDADNVYRFTHPPSAARMQFQMDEILAWCSHQKPALEDWLRNKFWELMRLTAGALVAEGAGVWANQISFLNSPEGKQYTATIRKGIADYREALPDDDEEPQTGEIQEEIRIQLSSTEGNAQSEQDLDAFVELLRAENLQFTPRSMAFDTTGAEQAAGLLAITVSVVGPVAVVQLRKLLEKFIAGRKIKLTNGTVKFEGSVKDLQALLTPEQIHQLTEPKAIKKSLPPASRKRGASD
jgi:hypothetical protein